MGLPWWIGIEEGTFSSKSYLKLGMWKSCQSSSASSLGDLCVDCTCVIRRATSLKRPAMIVVGFMHRPVQLYPYLEKFFRPISSLLLPISTRSPASIIFCAAMPVLFHSLISSAWHPLITIVQMPPIWKIKTVIWPPT